MYKHVFIDLDDTIWDFHANSMNSLQITFDHLGLDAYFNSFEDFFEIYRKRNLELWELHGKGEITKSFLQAERFYYPLRKVGIEDERVGEKMGKMYLELMTERTILIPHARELLDYLSTKYTLTIISNGFSEVQYRKLKNSNLAHYFAHVVLSEDVGALKPDRKIFDFALKLNDAQAEECIMIGDIFRLDVIGAQNAGIDQIFFNLHKQELKENETASYVVESLKEIFEIL
jgi:putative hydrolase of the HAD superfamily